MLNPHSNSVAFGSEYAEEGDEFPLLYANNHAGTKTLRDKGQTTQYFSFHMPKLSVGDFAGILFTVDFGTDLKL